MFNLFVVVALAYSFIRSGQYLERNDGWGYLAWVWAGLVSMFVLICLVGGV